MALNWIEGVLKRSTHTGTDLLLMLLLAEAADRDSGTCYPGLATLARLMRCGERNVQKRLQDLKASGEISVRQQKSPFGTNLYILSPSLLGDELQGVPAMLTTGRDEPGDVPQNDSSTNQSSTPRTPCSSPKPSVEPSVKNKRDTSLLMSGFDEWYALYPRKEKKADARRAWTKLTDEQKELAMTGIQRLLPHYRTKEAKFIPLPTTWLNGERWTDEPPSTNGKYIHQRDNLPERGQDLGWSDPNGPWKGKVIRVGPAE